MRSGTPVAVVRRCCLYNDKDSAHWITVSLTGRRRLAHAGTDVALPHFVKDGHSDDDVIGGFG
jgi:hypothetical protein